MRRTERPAAPAPAVGLCSGMSDALHTPRSTLAAGYGRVLVWCKACRHRADADLPGLVSASRATDAERAPPPPRAAR